MRASWLITLFLAALGCAAGNDATLDPIPAQSVRVSATLRVPLVVQSSESNYDLRFDGPDLPGLGVTSNISTGAGGGEFQWTPLASHVGKHEFVFNLVVGGEVVDSQPTLITVEPADDAAPVFVQPGPGGTYDLSRNPCVAFNVEVRDNDSDEVTITAAADVPLGADPISSTGPKSAMFEWCPTQDQITASQRWAVRLSADDGEHPPTLLDHVIILRAQAKADCRGKPPTIEIVSPTQGERVPGSPSFTVKINATDEGSIREAPILYYTMTRPDDFLDPEIATFTGQTDATGAGPEYEATIPDLGLDPGDELTLYLVASVTDNDDESGTRCDHRTDTSVISFVAVGTDALGADCARCSGSSRCSSAICASGSNGVSQCLPACAACPEDCVQVTTVEGLTQQSCAPSSCDSGPDCTDDALENNDSVATATPLGAGGRSATLCSPNVDFYKIDVPAGTRTQITLTGDASATADLDLMLMDGNGRVLQVSESYSNNEIIYHCSPSATTVYARVYAIGEQASNYDISITQSSATCCVDDAFEDDDSIADARMLTGDAFDGTICAGDSDYIGFSIGEPTDIEAVIVFENSKGDLDLGLADSQGFLLAASATDQDIEEISGILPDPGSYILLVTGHQDAETDYIGSLTLSPVSGCSSSSDCGEEMVCDQGVCVDWSCQSNAECPTDHLCVKLGPDSNAKVCAPTCSVNRDCASSEACKRFPEGRACGKTGSGQNGDVCLDFRSCGGQRACLDFPDGYCARAGCTTESDCESGTHCVPLEGMNVCARGCADVTCRFFYECADAVDTASNDQIVCAPL